MSFVCTISNFLNYPSLPELMQGIAGAVITLQISFAIGILIELFKDQNKPEGGLELRVMLDEVWRFKQTVVITLITFFLPFLLSIHDLIFKSFVFILWLIAFYFLVIPLFRLYDWVKGNKDDARLVYLSKSSVKTPITGDLLGWIRGFSFRDKIESWKSLWDKKSDSGFKDKEYFNLFSKEIDQLFLIDSGKELKLAEGLLTKFTENIEKRDLTFITVFDDFFPKILDWNLWIWRKQYADFAKDKEVTIKDSDKDISYINIDLAIDKIIKYVTEKSLSRQSAFSYFKHLEKHIEKHKNEIVIGEEHQYIYVEHIPIYRDILEKVSDSDSSYDIWNHYFPKAWKITPQNFKENIETRIWFKDFLDWAQSRIWQKTDDEWDKKLDEVSKELFPNISPSLWSRVITFVLSSWSDSRIKNVIESKRTVGFIGRIVTGWGGDEVSVETRLQESHINEEKETIELTLLLFGNIFTAENIEGYIKELNGFDYQSDSKEQNEKLLWLDFLKKIQDHRKNLVV